METSAALLQQVTILWLPVLLPTLCAAQEKLHIINLDCYNDYITQMFCTWKVSNANTNCSHDFLLKYNLKRRTSYCVPENAPLSDSRSPSECICYISADFFVVADIYYIQVKSRGGSCQNTTIVPANKVKPKTPANVTIEHGPDETGIVCWDSGYTDEDYLFQQLIFEVQTSTVQEPKEVEVTALHQVESCYVIKKRLLRRSQDYRITVRSKPNGIDYNGVWSEWSSAAVWHNDYDLQFLEIMVIMIPSSASMIFVCILLCSACTYLCKKKWLNTIPDPGKSHLLSTMMIKSQVSVLKSDINCKILPSKKKRKRDKSIWISPPFSGYQDLVGPFIMIPEITTVEKPVDISSLHDDSNSFNHLEEDEEVSEARDHIPECDDINRLFLEILEDDREAVMVMDNADSSEKQDQNGISLQADLCLTSSLQTSSGLVHSSYTNEYLPQGGTTKPVLSMPYIRCETMPAPDHYQPVRQNETTSHTEASPCLERVSDYQSFDTANKQQGDVTPTKCTTIEFGYKPF